MLNREGGNKRPFPRVKSPVQLPEMLNRRLSSYAMAAAAAGVATVACSVPAEAAPVCKNVSIQLFATTTFSLNPANQIAPPFNIAQSTFSYFTSGGYYFPWWNRAFFVPNTAGANVLLGAKSFPADVASGASIGPGGQFGKGKSYGLMFTYGKGPLFFRANGTLNRHRGNFNLEETNFIGFEFLQGGNVHYGWARLRVKIVHRRSYEPETITQVLGWGYETTPNTAIAAGDCSGSAQADAGGISKDNQSKTDQAGSEVSVSRLGILALGSEGLSMWRGKSLH
jgi:hypothetical protein